MLFVKSPGVRRREEEGGHMVDYLHTYPKWVIWCILWYSSPIEIILERQAEDGSLYLAVAKYIITWFLSWYIFINVKLCQRQWSITFIDWLPPAANGTHSAFHKSVTQSLSQGRQSPIDVDSIQPWIPDGATTLSLPLLLLIIVIVLIAD